MVASGNLYLAQNFSDIHNNKSIPPRHFNYKKINLLHFCRCSTFYILCIVLFFASFGCVRQQQAVADEIQSYRSGDLNISSSSTSPKLIYVEARDAGRPLPVSQKLKSALAAENFRIVNTPSEANYILHLNVLQSGSVNTQIFQNLVDEGYGTQANFSGAGAEGLLVDALLVQRRIPSHSRPSKAKLKNISTRNALESAQMRVGVMMPRQVVDHTSAREALSLHLARILRDSLANETVADATIN